MPVANRYQTTTRLTSIYRKMQSPFKKSSRLMMLVGLCPILLDSATGKAELYVYSSIRIAS